MIKIAERLQHVEEYYFSKKLEEIRQMREQGNEVLNLGIGSPDLPPERGVVQKLVDSAGKLGNHAYQPYRSTLELREAMSSFYYNTFSIKLNPQEEILPLLGSKEGILHISMTFINPGDVVLVPNPGYPAYSAIVKLLGAKVIHYNLRDENNWYPDFGELNNLELDKVKMMWVNYPHMPTGTKATSQVFQQLVDFARTNNILICNDNPYSQVLNDNPVSILQYDSGMNHVIELNSLSKSFNMAGWRVGMVLGHKMYIDAILQAKSNVDSGMFLPIQHAAIKAMQLTQKWHVKRNEIYRTRRLKALKILDLIGCSINDGQVGMFVWAKVPGHIKNTHDLIDDLLYNAHVFITPGEVFGSNGKMFIRLSLCSDEKIYDEAIKRIKAWQESSLKLV